MKALFGIVLPMVLVAVFPMSAGAQNLLTNGGFETGSLAPWVQYGNISGVKSGDFFGMTAPEGVYFLASVGSYGTVTGGVYQQVQLQQGTYTLIGQGQAHNRTDAFAYIPGQASSSPNDTQVSFLVDLAGGTDASKATRLGAEVNTGAAWGTVSRTFTVSTASTVTIFLNMRQQWADAGNWTGWDGVSLTLNPPPTGAIGGTVTDNAIPPNPIGGATITTNTGGYSTTTGSNGTYIISQVAPGTYSVTASNPGFTSQTQTGVSVNSNSTALASFMLQPSGNISGTVTDSTSSQAIAGAAVSTDTGGYSATTDSLGHYTLSDLAPGSYTVSASAVGYAGASIPGVQVAAGQTAADTSFSLSPIPVSNGLQNGQFEQGSDSSADAWYSYGPLDGRIGPYPYGQGSGYFFSITAAQGNGSYFFGSTTSYGTSTGLVMQRVKAIPGQAYSLGFDYLTYVEWDSAGDPSNDRISVYVDPDGGLTPPPDNDWATGQGVWTEFWSNPTDLSWHHAQVPVTAGSGGVITVYFKLHQFFAQHWNVTLIDNVSLGFPFTASSIGASRTQPDGTQIDMTGTSVVTLVPVSENGFFYAQDADGTAGIRVELKTGEVAPSLGDIVKLHGVLGTNPSGERTLLNATYDAEGTGGSTPIRRVGNKAVGGVGYTGAGGTPDAFGLSNQGLLMYVYGRVTKLDFINSAWWLDDGSGVDAQEPDATGVKVINSNVFPSPGDYVGIVGVVTSEMVNGKQVRVLRGRDGTVASDFDTLSPAAP